MQWMQYRSGSSCSIRAGGQGTVAEGREMFEEPRLAPLLLPIPAHHSQHRGPLKQGDKTCSERAKQSTRELGKLSG